MLQVANTLKFVTVGQRIAVVASCAGFWFLLLHKPSTSVVLYAIMGMLFLLACAEKLCSIMNMVSIERDWVRSVFWPLKCG